jgi:hypothetical protein
MYYWLQHIRKKPKHIREQYALFFSIIIMTVIVSVWSLSLPSQLQKITAADKDEQSAAAPLSGLFSGLKEQFTKSSTNNLPESGAGQNYIEEIVQGIQTGTQAIPEQNVATPMVVQIATTSEMTSSDFE